MREAIIALALLLVVGIVAATLRPAGQNEYFTVSIVQNGKVVEARGSIVHLQKAPFQLVFTMIQPMSLSIMASHNQSWYKRATLGVPLEGMIHPGLGYADTLFNSGQNLYISDTGMNYWFYSEEKDHRFDQVAYQNGAIVGVRTIENLYYPEKNQQIKVVNCTEQEIYLVFSYAHYNEQTQKYIEYQREMLQIKFN